VITTTNDISYRFLGPHRNRVVMHFEGSEFAADGSAGRFRNRLYAIWNTTMPDNVNRLYLSYSSDKGVTWSKPRDIDSAMPGDDYQANVAVNKDGTVGVIFYNSTADAQPEDRFDVYFTASGDGGRSFQRPVRVSSQSSYPDRAGNGRPILFWENRSKKTINALLAAGGAWDSQGGDYIGLTAD